MLKSKYFLRHMFYLYTISKELIKYSFYNNYTKTCFKLVINTNCSNACLIITICNLDKNLFNFYIKTFLNLTDL